MNVPATSKGPSNGVRLVLSFAVLTYVLPAIAYLVMEPEVHFRCPVDRLDVWAHLTIALACVAAGATAAGRPGRKSIAAPARGVPVALMVIALSAIAVGAPALLSGASGRYGSESLADQLADGQGGSAIAVVVLQAVAPLLAWWLFLRRPDLWRSRTGGSTMVRWTLAAATVACINGLSSAARAAVTLAMIAWPDAGHRLLFAADQGRGTRARGIGFAIGGFAAVAVAVAAIGLRAKTGSAGTDEAWGRYTDPAYLVGRNSVHFQHAMAGLEVGIEEGDHTAEFVDRAMIAIDDARYRIGALTGNPAWGARPDPSSLSRVTFERFALFEPSGRMARGGSSPSVIGAFALCLPPPWSFAAMGAFAWLLVRWLDWLLAGTPRISWLGCAIIAFGPLRIITDTPTNLPNPFGIPFIVVSLATVARLLSSYAAVPQPAPAHERPA